jgi:hypothetical protein
MFSGWNSSLLQDCVFSATQFVVYEQVGERMQPPVRGCVPRACACACTCS